MKTSIIERNNFFLRKVIKAHILFIMILCGFATSECFAWSFQNHIPPHGKVIDGSTGAAVEKAYVIARFYADAPYELFSFIDPGSVRKNITIGTLFTLTNEKGEFDFSNETPGYLTSSEYKRNPQVRVTAYAPGFSHEVNKGYQSWINGNYVIVKYEDFDGSDMTLRLTPQVDSAYSSRYEYLSNLPIALYDAPKHNIKLQWFMAQTVMADMQEHALTSRDWTYINELCHLLNNIKIQGQLDVIEKSCEDFITKIKQVSKDEFLKVKKNIADIDWGEGPELELIKYNIHQMNSGESVFLVRDHSSGLDADQLSVLLKKVCDSDYPGDFNLGTACIFFEKKAIENREAGKCHADARFGHLDVNYGVAKGSTLKLETNWCRNKSFPPPYRWPK